MVLFLLWPEYRQDFRADEFKAATQAVLTRVEHSADRYNRDVQAVRETTKGILARYIEAAVSELVQTSDYIQWQHEEAERRASNIVLMPDEQKWYAHVERVGPPNVGTSTTVQMIGQRMAEWWLDSRRSLEGTGRTHVWLLAEQPERAAAYVQSGHTLDMQAPPPPLDWLVPIFDKTYAELRESDAYQAAQATLKDLLHHTRTAEHLLETGLRRIQELYEGGSPLV